jgi:hypothetical protein
MNNIIYAILFKFFKNKRNKEKKIRMNKYFLFFLNK